MDERHSVTRNYERKSKANLSTSGWVALGQERHESTCCNRTAMSSLAFCCMVLKDLKGNLWQCLVVTSLGAGDPNSGKPAKRSRSATTCTFCFQNMNYGQNEI